VTVSRARQMLGFIMRVGRDFREPYAVKSLYVSLVRSKLEYASCVWMPYQNGRIADYLISRECHFWIGDSRFEKIYFYKHNSC
jgi:hypothetical protein